MLQLALAPGSAQEVAVARIMVVLTLSR